MTIKAIAFAAVLGLSSAVPIAHANLVTNGDFNSSTYTQNTEFGTAWAQANQQGVDGWTGNGGYDLFFTSAAASTTQNALGQYSYTGNEKLWNAVASPGGGSFVALDGEQVSNDQGGVSQLIAGLVAGMKYTLSFDWGVGEMQSRYGATSEQFQASLGSQSFVTSVVANPAQGFSGWMNQVFTFTATGSSELLSFLSIGTPLGLPPMATLDDVSLVAVPEPVSLALLGAGLVGLGFVRRRR